MEDLPEGNTQSSDLTKERIKTGWQNVQNTKDFHKCLNMNNLLGVTRWYC